MSAVSGASKAVRPRRLIGIVSTAAVIGVLAACGSGSGSAGASGGGDVKLEFAQWWAAELPDGAFDKIVDEFETANPGITVELVTAPYASTKQQLVSGAASRTLPDVVGLDGAWVNDFSKQGAIADLSELMSQAGYDESQLASQIKVDGATYMIPVVNFVYPLFVNTDLLKEAGVNDVPATRTEFVEAAKKISALGDNKKGWALPLDTSAPNGAQNDVMSWLWASGGSMLADGKPNVNTPEVKSVIDMIKGLTDADAVAPAT